MRAFLVFFLAAFVVCEAFAFTLAPFRASLAPVGKDATKLFRVTNTQKKSIAVQISALTRDIDINGKETTQKADSHFVIYPPQMILAPNESRSVRVQWVGDTNIAEEKLYRLVAEELPVKLDDKQDGNVLNMLIRYEAALYITPEKVAEDVQVDSVKPVNKAGKKYVEVVFANAGKSHSRLRNLSLEFAGEGGSKASLTKEALQGVAGETIMPGKKRRFLIAWPKGLKGDQLSLKFNHDRVM